MALYFPPISNNSGKYAEKPVPDSVMPVMEGLAGPIGRERPPRGPPIGNGRWDLIERSSNWSRPPPGLSREVAKLTGGPRVRAQASRPSRSELVGAGTVGVDVSRYELVSRIAASCFTSFFGA